MTVVRKWRRRTLLHAALRLLWLDGPVSPPSEAHTRVSFTFGSVISTRRYTMVKVAPTEQPESHRLLSTGKLGHAPTSDCSLGHSPPSDVWFMGLHWRKYKETWVEKVMTTIQRNYSAFYNCAVVKAGYEDTTISSFECNNSTERTGKFGKL